ncbi:YitT family protein [Mycoplasma seminis]|uniref:YitT family protein n=1 Tax=Mycoplasma seminis TaxID=512749 RepID=A0ABY9HAB3_9MOLU|nr:YitT family protein [Mycoplasma seminis]WLP85371.1 YitT family protein [Mycoplasma seminis]
MGAKKEYTRQKIKSSLLVFGFLYKIQKPWQKFGVMTIIGLVMGLCGVLLLQNTGLYALGLEAFGQGVGSFFLYLITSKYQNPELGYIIYNLCFWLIYFILNIPLLILSWKKISHSFTLYTLYYLAVFTVAGVMFGFIPGISDIYLFTNLKDSMPEAFLYKGDEMVQIVLWNYNAGAMKHMAIFLYSICWGMLQGIAAVACIIIGSSTGGFDIYGMYIAKAKLKDIGTVFLFLNFISLTLANIIGTYVPASLSLENASESITKLNKPWALDIFFNLNYVSGFFMLLINAFIVNITYPKNKLVQTQIYCDRPFELIEQINELSHRTYTFSVVEVIGGYSRKKKYMITTNTQYLDAADLFIVTKQINKDLFISILDLKKGDGYMFIEK